MYPRDMTGIRYSATAPIRLAPPKITRATRAPAKSPTIRLPRGEGVSPRKMSASLMLVTAVLIWVELPTPKAATMPKAQKSPPSQVHFLPRPFLM